MPLLCELLVRPEIDSGVWQAVQHSDAIALPEGTHTLTLDDLVHCLLQCGLVDVASGGLQAFNLCSTAGCEMHSSRCGRDMRHNKSVAHGFDTYSGVLNTRYLVQYCQPSQRCCSRL